MAVNPDEQLRTMIANLEEKTGRSLEASGGFNAVASHRVRPASPDDVVDELRRGLEAAYRDA